MIVWTATARRGAGAKLPTAGIVCLNVGVYRRTQESRRRSSKIVREIATLSLFRASQRPKNDAAFGPARALTEADQHRSATGNGDDNGTFKLGHLSVLDFYCLQRKQIIGVVQGTIWISATIFFES